MYILIALVLACSVGIAAHYALPGRDLRGVVVSPAIATVAAGAVYTGLQWAGLAQNNIWLWLASVGGGIAIGVAATIALTRSREQRDAARAEELGLTPR